MFKMANTYCYFLFTSNKLQVLVSTLSIQSTFKYKYILKTDIGLKYKYKYSKLYLSVLKYVLGPNPVAYYCIPLDPTH